MSSSPALWVIDTSILIPYLRFGQYREFLLAGLERGTIFLPGVVICELYAGTTSRNDRADVETLRRALGPHLLAIEAEDWMLAGRCLSYYSTCWGKIQPQDHLADVLVAVSAIRIGAVLGSRDLSQMRRWSWVLARLNRKLNVRGVAE